MQISPHNKVSSFIFKIKINFLIKNILFRVPNENKENTHGTFSLTTHIDNDICYKNHVIPISCDKMSIMLTLKEVY